MKSLKKRYGPWAVITGASDGIGKAFAEEAAKHGINVILIARRKVFLDSLSRELINQYDVEAHVIVADLSSDDGVNLMLKETEQFDVGLFIASAGFGTSGDFVDIPLETELNMLDVNCRAVIASTHHFAKRFKDRSRGGIVLFGSLVGFQGTPRSANYAATKAYIQCFAEGLRVELKPHHVDVLAVAPGPVSTGFAKRVNMIMGGADQPIAVAKESLKALGNTITVRPGFFGKFLGYSLAMLPRWGRIQVMTLVMGGMQASKKCLTQLVLTCCSESQTDV